MKYPWIDEYLLSKPGVTKNSENWNWDRYMIGGKMFAAVCMDDATNQPYYITLKLEHLEGELLRQQYPDILPGYYMNKTHWNSVRAQGELPEDILRGMLEESYRLVAAGLPKAQRAALGLLE